MLTFITDVAAAKAAAHQTQQFNEPKDVRIPVGIVLLFAEAVLLVAPADSCLETRTWELVACAAQASQEEERDGREAFCCLLLAEQLNMIADGTRAGRKPGAF